MPKTNIVILTGAGISQESGLDTFRCEGGVWSKVRIEDVCTPEAYLRNPALVQHFYNDRRLGLQDAEPNAAHRALAELEQRWTQGSVLIVTQNIDDLHDRAGSQNLIHMHGELRKVRCTACGALLPWDAVVELQTPCPCCRKTASLRPHVVWFGEVPLEMERIYRALEQCDLFVSIGTSGHVYPAAGFVSAINQIGRAETVELNLERSEGSHLFDRSLQGRASEIVPAFVRELLARQDDSLRKI